MAHLERRMSRAFACLLALLLIVSGSGLAGQLVGGAAAPSTCGSGPAPPAAAAAAGYTCRVFFDDFTSISTIDTTNTLAPTFKWYNGNNWPRGQEGYAWPGASPTYTPTPVSWYSLVSGGIALTPLANDARGQVMLSTCAPTTTPPYWTGTAFTGGWFLRFVMGAITGSSADQAWPLIWTWPIEYLVGVPGVMHFTENDHMEGDRGAVQPNLYRELFYWGFNGTGGTEHDRLIGPQTIPTGGGAVTDSLMVPAAENAGVGKLDWYVNGVVTHVSPASWDNPPSGDAFDRLTTTNNCLLMGTGFGTTMIVRSVEVWQRPP